MTNHKHLTDLGIKPYEIASNWCESDTREAKWSEERATYGFDERETWSLYISFYQWLYERLMMYKAIGGKTINLNFHKFEYNGEGKTQEELIDLMIEYLKIALLDDFWDTDEAKFNKVMEIGKIWAIVLPAMWW